MASTDAPRSHLSDIRPTFQPVAPSPGSPDAPVVSAHALHSSVFSCSISRRSGRVAIGIVGEIDRTSAGQFRNQLLGVAKEHPAAIEIDMKLVALADEAGVAVLIEAWRFAMEHGIELAVKSPPAAVTQTFDIAPTGWLVALRS